MLQITDLSEEAFFYFMDGLKSQVKQELEHQGVQELSKAMIMTKSLIKFVLRKDNFESSKPKGKMKNDKLRIATIVLTMRNQKMGKGNLTVNRRGH